MRVALVQQASTLDPAENRAAVEALAGDPAVQDADLVVLPEAFQRDFGSPSESLAEHAEPVAGPFGASVQTLAGTRRTVVAGMFEAGPDPERPWNTLLVRGQAHTSYRKIHLYDSFGYRESDRLVEGAWEPVTFPLGDFTVGLMTCYDLRFPELARALVEAGADLLVCPAAWVPGPTPEEHARKIDHWQTLVRARAIENTVYVVAVGQPAPRYTGHSMVVAPNGDVIAGAGAEPTVLTAELRRDVVDRAREQNPSLANRRQVGQPSATTPA